MLFDMATTTFDQLSEQKTISRLRDLGTEGMLIEASFDHLRLVSKI